MSLGDAVLRALLNRLTPRTPLQTDLVIVRDHPALADTPSVIRRDDGDWRFVRVRGELGLRDALYGDGPLFAAVPYGFAPPLDIAMRSYLKQPLTIRADDVVAGLANRPCAPLDDELTAAVNELLPLLRERASAFTMSGVVSEGELRRVMVSVLLGADRRLDREPPEKLLAAWIAEGPPNLPRTSLLHRALTDAHGRAGAWLAHALAGGLDAIVTAGALASAPTAGMPELSSPRDRDGLRDLVERAVEIVWQEPTKQPAVEARLAAAESGFYRSRLEDQAARHPLLRAALESALHAQARAAAVGEPVDDDRIVALRRNLHARRFPDGIAYVRHISRLARFLRAAPKPAEPSLQAWCDVARGHTSWADRAARDARRLHGAVSADLRAAGSVVLDAYLSRRDGLNEQFAARLGEAFGAFVGSKNLRHALPLQQVSRSLVKRLVDQGHRVFLLVLDGCDLSTFIELVDSLPEDLGLVLPSVDDAPLAEDLRAASALSTAVAPLPTVTSHSRRALFAGDIPDDTVLDDVEAYAPSASGDQAAFDRNTALKPYARQLVLKGEIGVDGVVLRDALENSSLQIVATVANGVDDALSSKETTALGPWRFEGLGGGFLQNVRRAVELGWTVLVTADHGHTPFWHPERKAATKAQGHRWGTSPIDGALRFAGPSIPNGPVWLMTRVGAYAGQQARGFHGGASLEEVVVPLAFLGRVAPGTGRAAPPAWWSTDDVGSASAPVVEAPSPAPPPPAAAVAALPAAFRAQITNQKHLFVLQLLLEKQLLSESQLAAALKLQPTFARGFMSTLEQSLNRAGLPVPYTEESQGEATFYRWKHRS